MLAIGCEDGSVRLISLLYGALEHHKRFDRSKSRILSIAWGPPELKMSKPSEDTSMGDDTSSEVDDEDDEGWEDTWLVTGGSDSCIRKWNVKTGRTTDRMETDKARGERTLVWAVQVLADSTIVSGDSMGMVKFWDASTATQFHSFRAHGADVLTLAVSPNGTSIYSAGVDQKVTEFTLSGSTSRRWVQTYSRRLHAHDIRSIAIWPPYTLCTAPKERPLINTGSAPILASGGLDMVVCLTPCAPASQGLEQRIKIVNPLATGNHSTFEESFQRRMAYPVTGVLSFAREARFVMCRMNRGITIWRIGSLEDESDRANDVSEPTNWELVLEMELNAKTNLIAGAISADGTWVAVSDAKETKLFRLEDSKKVIPHRIKTFGSVLASANADLAASTASSDLSFTPDSSKLIMSCFPSSFVVIIDLTPSTSNEDAAPRVLRTFGQHRMKQARSGRVVKKMVLQRRGDDEEEMEDEQPQANLSDNDEDGEGQSEEVHAAVCCTAVSADGQWFASADLRGRCHVFNIDSLQHHCTLPSFELPIRSLVFDPRSSDTLLIGLPNNRIHVFDIEERMFPQWASRVCDNLPQSFTGLHDPLQGLMFVHPSSSSSSFTPSPRQVIAYGSNWLCKIKLDAGVATRKGFRSKDRRKRKTQKSAIEASNEETNEHNFTVVTKYRHMLGVGQLGDQELVIVERPLVDLLSGKGQPPPYYKHRYGT
ncbi:U3 small nucleolar RNA-associated protein [Tulasnella sp. 418]|nr:U3 small nucleolar RNA-associated protein [Tulasnella sp. 418]